jgi:tricorn protease-like protein
VVKTVIIVTNPKNNIDPNDVPDIEKDDVAKYVSKLYNYLLSIPGNTNVSIVPYNNSNEKGLSIVFVVDGKTVKEVKEELTNLRVSAENWARREGLQLKIIWHIDKE